MEAQETGPDNQETGVPGGGSPVNKGCDGGECSLARAEQIMLHAGGISGDPQHIGHTAFRSQLLDRRKKSANTFLSCPQHSLESLPEQTDKQLVSTLSMVPL